MVITVNIKGEIAQLSRDSDGAWTFAVFSTDPVASARLRDVLYVILQALQGVGGDHAKQ